MDQRSSAQPVDQLVTIGRAEHVSQRIARFRCAMSGRHRQQMQIVIAEHRDRCDHRAALTKRSVASDAGPRLTRSPTNQSWSRRFVEIDQFEQTLQRVVTTLVHRRSRRRTSMDQVGYRQRKHRNRHEEAFAAIGFELVVTLHRADGRLEHRCAGIPKRARRARCAALHPRRRGRAPPGARRPRS